MQIREVVCWCISKHNYTPFDKVLSSFAGKTFKAMTLVDLSTYLVVKPFLGSIVPSYPKIKGGYRTNMS